MSDRFDNFEFHWTFFQVLIWRLGKEQDQEDRGEKCGTERGKKGNISMKMKGKVMNRGQKRVERKG